MEKETITLSKSELRRLRLLNQVLAGERTLVEVAQVLQLSVRQVRRLLKRYREQGAAALEPCLLPQTQFARACDEPSADHPGAAA